jgi:hypothetical protein
VHASAMATVTRISVNPWRHRAIAITTLLREAASGSSSAGGENNSLDAEGKGTTASSLQRKRMGQRDEKENGEKERQAPMTYFSLQTQTKKMGQEAFCTYSHYTPPLSFFFLASACYVWSSGEKDRGKTHAAVHSDICKHTDTHSHMHVMSAQSYILQIA